MKIDESFQLRGGQGLSQRELNFNLFQKVGCRTRVARRVVLGVLLVLTTAKIGSAPVWGRTLSHALELQTFPSHSRFSVRVDSQVAPRWKSDSKGFVLILKGITLADLGAPFGAEENWVRQFSELKDQRLKSVKLAESADGVTVEGSWGYPTGKEALAKPNMEIFDFKQDDPSRVVLDFWHKKGPTVEQAHILEVKAKKAEVAQSQMNRAKQQEARGRQIALAIKEAENLQPYCDKNFTEAGEIVLPFNPVHARVTFTQWFSMTTPDVDYPYLEPSGEERDAQYVRLAIKLYRGANPALAVRTIEFLQKEFPHSRYLPEMKFLRANAQIRLGHLELAQEQLKEIASDQKSTPAALYSGMYIAGHAFEAGEFLMALEKFSWLMDHFPGHRLEWVFHLGAAESAYELKQLERTVREYRWIVENHTDPIVQAQSAAKQGDLYLSRQQYEQALAAYFGASKYFPKETANIPELIINRGETLYQLGQHDRARVVFENYLKDFEGNPEGWRATFRLAEISARDKGPEASTKARNFYAQSINRYPFSPAATLARMRLMPCGDHGGFTVSSANRFFSEDVSKIEKSKDLDLSRYFDFITLAKLRAWVAFEKYEDALQVAGDSLDKKLSAQTREEVAQTYKRVLRKAVIESLDSGKPFEALSLFQRYSDTLKTLAQHGKSIPSDFMLRLSKAAAEMQLGQVAMDLVDRYESHIPGFDRAIASVDVVSRQEQARVAIARARAIWVKNGMESESEIRKVLSEVAEDTQYSFEKEILMSVIEYRKNAPKTALGHALRAQLLLNSGIRVGAELDQNRLQILSWIGRLQVDSDQTKGATETFAAVREILIKTNENPLSIWGVPNTPSESGMLIEEARLCEKQKRWGDAARLYADAVAKGEEKSPILYALATTLRKVGDPKSNSEANRIFKKIADGQDGSWPKLAAQALDGTQTTEGRP